MVNRLLLIFLLLFLSVSCERENGGVDTGSDTIGNVDSGEVVGDGLFSVSEITKVKFAPGNLKPGGHGFTDHQYDLGGLFGWGTGNRPTITTVDAGSYLGFYDWGNYNSGGEWRTLSAEEWQYLLFRRDGAMSKYSGGTVWGVHGVVLLPDNWVLPTGCIFKPRSGWRGNIYDLDQWSKMEVAGAVFLPAAGYRWDTDVSFAGVGGYYWTSSTDLPNSAAASYFCFGEFDAGVENGSRAMGCSVRLVEDKN